jgi:hypothetical protein
MVWGNPRSREVNVRVYFSKPGTEEDGSGVCLNPRFVGEKQGLWLPESEVVEDMVEPSESRREGGEPGVLGAEDVSAEYEYWRERAFGPVRKAGGAEEVLDLDISN